MARSCRKNVENYDMHMKPGRKDALPAAHRGIYYPMAAMMHGSSNCDLSGAVLGVAEELKFLLDS